jgi:acyl-CoA reductase-like NAD-dependent aldehyde dehydrogenase
VTEPDAVEVEPRPCWIAGSPEPSPDSVVVRHPFDGTEVAEVAVPNQAQRDRAVAAAVAAAGALGRSPAHQRTAALAALAEELAGRSEELAEIITAESGKPLLWAEHEVAGAVAACAVAAAEPPGERAGRLDADPAGEGRLTVTTRRSPGPVLGLGGTDFPLLGPTQQAALAIAAGAPVVLLPAAATPLSALLLGECLAGLDLPGGAFSVLPQPDPATPAADLGRSDAPAGPPQVEPATDSQLSTGPDLLAALRIDPAAHVTGSTPDAPSGAPQADAATPAADSGLSAGPAPGPRHADPAALVTGSRRSAGPGHATPDLPGGAAAGTHQGAPALPDVPGDEFSGLTRLSAAVVADPRLAVVLVAGSVEPVRAVAPGKRVLGGPGGVGVAIVGPDWNSVADLGFAASRIVGQATGQAGQSAVAVRRAVVHADVAAGFRAAVLAAVAELGTGDPHDPEVEVGPMISAAAAQQVLDWVRQAEAAGATVLAGGHRTGTTVEPTVLVDVPAELPAQPPGPVLTLSVVDSVSAGCALADAIGGGAPVGLFSHDTAAAFAAAAELSADTVIVGDVPGGGPDAPPYGGLAALTRAQTLVLTNLPL